MSQVRDTEPLADSEDAACIACGAKPCSILSPDGPICDGCGGCPATQLPYTTPIPTEYSDRDIVAVVTTAARPVGPSPYPCPRCRSIINITCSYQGRREEWLCGHCGFGWSMNATAEQPT